MNFLQQVQIATQAYLKHAYPKGIPGKVQNKIGEMGELGSKEELLQWPGFEIEDQHFFLRLGNFQYPHMKLVFLLEEGRPVFYVDAHDGHFDVPPGVPGYDKLMGLREQNKKLKKEIEAALVAEKLPLFGKANQMVLPHKNVCCGIKVMAVDDELQILDMIGLIVSSLGAKYFRAQNAEEAKALIEQEGPPDLIFCDIMMPGESGYQLVEWLKKRQVQTKIYYITGLTRDKVVDEGVEQVLQKPFSAKTIMNLMKSACNEQR